MHYIILLLLALPAISHGTTIRYQLHADIDPAGGQLHATARLSTDATLTTDGLSDIFLDGTAHPAGKPLQVQAAQEIRYRYTLPDNDARHVLLYGAWYPQPAQPVVYQFSVTLPAAFQAISEAEVIQRETTGDNTRIVFDFSYPLDQLTLAASDRYQIQREDYQGIQVETWFFPESAELAERYLAYAKKYLQLYQDLLTPYPYRRFAMVENRFPTGWSLPTYTLLGSRVIRLPFIVETSLGHEILHQWFGNSVYIDSAHGNWAEGLTRYLSDYYYAEQKGEGAAYRKRMAAEYAAYVTPDKALAVKDFRSRVDRGHSAVGYTKAAMIFHQLRQRYGDAVFFAALQDFIRGNTFREASWHDLQRAFEKAGGDSLYAWFGQWLTRDDIPHLTLKDSPVLTVAQGKLKLKFKLKQHTATPYTLRVPLQIHYPLKTRTAFLNLKTAFEEFELVLEDWPLRVTLDPEYHLMRRLDAPERAPSLAWLLGQTEVSVAAADQARYRPLLEALEIPQLSVQADIDWAQIRNNSVILAGYDNPAIAMLFGKQTLPAEGVRLRVYRNPYHEDKVILLLHAASDEEAQAAAPKLRHYGQYSELAFDRGRNRLKRHAQTPDGIAVLERTPVRVVQPARLGGLDEVISAESVARGYVPAPAKTENARGRNPALPSSEAAARIIFIGEQHDQFAHHINQWLLIKKWVAAGHKVAVGMEMFQQPYQQALDDYLAGTIDEAAFLEQSHYFDKWRYDYNLYKPILDYAKAEGLPVLALNIEGDVNHKVGREGISALDEQARAHLPTQMDLSDARYRHDLTEVFDVHRHMGSGHQEFDYFLQSQALWDESMAEAAAAFLADHPDHTLVILAGNGHLQYGYGIPQRLYRRTGLPSTVILQDTPLADGIADYVLLTTPLEGEMTPLLGVFVETVDAQLLVRKVSENSAAQKAGIQARDVITRVNGRPLTRLGQLKLALMYADIQQPVVVEILRDGQALTKQVTLRREESEAYQHTFRHRK